MACALRQVGYEHTWTVWSDAYRILKAALEAQCRVVDMEYDIRHLGVSLLVNEALRPCEDSSSELHGLHLQRTPLIACSLAGAAAGRLPPTKSAPKPIQTGRPPPLPLARSIFL
jgi:hypothetical protein